ncbi:MAG: hypothetical protein P9M13_08405 [Candidatus Ancaeobacter aquaticus]|nr:hypothetical protein [Candidatus Ancaeobacter aquaticus]
MATKHPRLNVVLDPSLYAAVLKLSKKDGVSLSLKARDLIKDALEYCEDAYWTNEATDREKTFNRKNALDHNKVWK